MPSKAPHPPRWHPAAEVVRQRSSLAHHGLATVPKVTQSALEWSQTVEPRPEIKKTAREEGRGGEGREGGTEEEREEETGFFSVHPAIQLFCPSSSN